MSSLVLCLNLLHLLIDASHLVEKPRFLELFGMAFMDEFVFCLEVFVIIEIGLLPIAHC